MSMPSLRISRGRPIPFGATPFADGVNFALLCRHGTAVTLVLSPSNSNDVFAEISLDPLKNRTGNVWHIVIDGLPNAFRYGWKVDGPAGSPHRFDPSIVLIDPAATLVADGGKWGTQCEVNRRTSVRRGLYVRGPRYDWEDDHPPRIPLEDSIIYELHVRGFTVMPNSGVADSNRGTFAGLVEKASYLRWLGVTTIELLPIHEFDECDCPFTNPETGEKLLNFWGYNSIAFAAPKEAYAATGVAHGQVHEFRDMVKVIHKAGLEIILDVVFNHTAEGDDRGRTFSFRGLDNELYYLLDSDGRYLNFTGCGNTLNCNHPIVRDQLMGCLRYWVAHMHVDGFRFDLASVLGRDREGQVMINPPVVESIVEDGVLADSKLIAEPWDAAGLDQVGRFPYGRRWTEWNGRYRDAVRRFWRGDDDTVSELATRICGSADLYQESGRTPQHSINFVTCHDGFTLCDLVSYSRKHNLANGEGNRDGSDENHSWNCGTEGPTTDPAINQLRERQARNFIATLMLSQGVPMLLAGDEFLRTQKGNNNPWCQDNEISWVDWSFQEKNAGFLRFTREMIQFRQRHPALRRRTFLSPGDIIWHGSEPFQPDFSLSSRFLAFVLEGNRTGREPDSDILVAMNGSRNSQPFTIPAVPRGTNWKRIVDTGKVAPDDFVSVESAGPELVTGSQIEMMPLSTVVCVSSLPET